jgi:hypothetical protein
MSQTQNPCNQQPQTRREIIEEGVGYKVYRECDHLGTPIRLVKEYYYKEYEDNLKAEFKIEIAYNNVLVIEVTKTIIGKSVGGAVLRDIRLDVEALKRVQDLMLRVKNRQQFDELLHWLITAKYTPKCTAMNIENPDPF